MAAQGADEDVNTVWKAAAYGNYEKLVELAEAVPEQLSAPDEQGFYVAQWAALNNRIAILNFLVDRGVDVDAADATGQTALHWAAVRGAVQAAETLLRAGASLGAADSRGYTPCHVAAQYGQTGLLYHLACRWNADTDAPDADGRTPTHWAAYKGFADTLRLLLFLGGRAALADREGCTPLHWAAIKGNAEACTVLVQGGAGEVLGEPDASGATPSQLAIEKGHRLLGLHLAEQRRKLEGERRRGVGGLLGRAHLAPVIWAIVLSLLAMLLALVVRNPQFPPPTPATVGGAWLTFALASVGLYFLFRTTAADPGYLPRGGSAARAGSAALWEKAGGAAGGGGPAAAAGASDLDNPALRAGQWHQLCVSCRIVRPLRTKHCAVTGRCVENFDHFCPWVGNVVGKGNRHLFLTFLWLELGALAAAALVAVIRIHAVAKLAGGMQRGGGLLLLWPVLFVVADVFLLISVAALACAQASQVSRNVTTNELANWHRYKYLHDGEGDFRNPFDRGCRANCAEACDPGRVPLAPYVLQQRPGGGEAGEGVALLKMEQGGAGEL
eukprot:scaffold1.g5208.t1